MNGLITALSAFGALLLGIAYFFFLSGEWLPAARDWLVPDTAGSRFLNNVGYAAALLAAFWTIMFIVNHRPIADRSAPVERVGQQVAAASPPSSRKP